MCYLYFQLKTHADSFAGGSDPGVSSTYASATDLVALQQQGAPRSAADGAPGGAESRPDSPAEDHHHHPTLSLSGALGTLTVITLLVAASSEYLTGALESVSSTFHINQAFLGLIVLPIAGNAAEHITAVFVAVKNKMDLAISVALGSSIQIAVFVLPVTVLAGWVMGKELTLNLDPFAVAMLTLSVVLTYFVSSDGLSNWLLGLQLVLTYVLIGSVYLLEKEAPAAPGMGGSFG